MHALIVALATLAQAPAPAVIETKPVEPVAPSKPRVLVLALKPLSVPTETTEIVDALVADALGKRKDIQVVSQAELKAMVELEQTKQAIGCDSSSCLGELAGAMGARYVVFGQLGTLGSSLVLTLNLYDSSKGQPVGREIVRAANADAIADQLPAAVAALGAGIKQAVPSGPSVDKRDTPQDGGSSVEKRDPTAEKPPESGTLRVDASVPGASVAIDGVDAGTAPFEGSAPPGAHKVTVSHAGFAPHASDVVITPGEVTTLSVRLRAQDDDGAGGSWLTTAGWITIGVAGAWTAVQSGIAVWSELTLRDPDAAVTDKQTARYGGLALLGAGAGVVAAGIGAALLFVPAEEG